MTQTADVEDIESITITYLVYATDPDVENVIGAIGTAEYTAECKAQIDAARAAYCTLFCGKDFVHTIIFDK